MNWSFRHPGNLSVSAHPTRPCWDRIPVLAQDEYPYCFEMPQTMSFAVAT